MQVSAFKEVSAGPDLEILYFINQFALFSLDITLNINHLNSNPHLNSFRNLYSLSKFHNA